MNAILILLLCISVGAGAQHHEVAIRQLLAHQQTAWNNGSIEGYMEGYWKNDSLVFIGGSGVTHGFSNVLANYKKSFPDSAAMGKLSFNLLSIKKLSSNYVFVVGKWHLSRKAGDAGGHFTLVIKKFGRLWRIVSDHTS